jgi:hypothetical protein
MLDHESKLGDGCWRSVTHCVVLDSDVVWDEANWMRQIVFVLSWVEGCPCSGCGRSYTVVGPIDYRWSYCRIIACRNRATVVSLFAS